MDIEEAREALALWKVAPRKHNAKVTSVDGYHFGLTTFYYGEERHTFHSLEELRASLDAERR